VQDGYLCDGGQRVVCKHGFATTSSEDCAGDGRFCVSANEDAFCALQPEPSELCSPGWGGDGCEGEQLIRCMYGYPISRSDCAALGEFCVVTLEFSFCNASSELDPLCPPDEYPAHFCAGNVVVGCTYGYRTGESPCGAGAVCQQDDAGHPTAGCLVER